MGKFRTLEPSEIFTILATSNCPVCHNFIQIHTEQTEEQLTTTTGTCETCSAQYAIDRTIVKPYEILGGHRYVIEVQE